MKPIYTSNTPERVLKIPRPMGIEPTQEPEDTLQSHYMAARREWNERYGDYISREQAWRRTTLIALGIALLSVGGLVYTSTQSKFIPYVVEVDKLGASTAIQRADVAAKADQRIIRAQLARWIANVRSVYQDAGAERMNIQEAYGMLRRNDAAHTLLNEYLTRHDPFERAQKEGVNVDIHSVLPISENTWQVEWSESVHSTKGDLIQTLPMQANITVLIDPPNDETGVLLNPLGVYVKSFHWSQKL